MIALLLIYGSALLGTGLAQAGGTGEVTKFNLGKDDAGSSISFWIQSAPVYGSTTVKNTGDSDFNLTTQLTLTNFFGGGKVAESAVHANTVRAGETYRAVDQLGCLIRENSAKCMNVPWLGLFWVSGSATFLGKTQDYRQLILILPWWAIILTVSALGLILAIWFIETHRHHNLKKKYGAAYTRQDIKQLEDSESYFPPAGGGVS